MKSSLGAGHMSFLGRLFGSDKALERVVDTATGLLDEAFYTKEEQAADRAVAREKAQGLVIEWMKASTGSRMARRVIAFGITGTWLLMYWFTAVLAVAGVWSPEMAVQLAASAEILDAAGDVMVSPVMLILGFYFAGPYMGNLAEGALKRFGAQSSGQRQ